MNIFTIPHAARKMKFIDKNRFLVETLGISESEIKTIRKIKSLEKRFIEAAKFQLEMFNTINGEVTAWLAGFPNESSVRNIFGSHLNLRSKVMKLPSSEFEYIKFSVNDIRRNVKIPTDIDSNLGEEIGIHIGDGSLFVANDRKWISYQYSLSGNLREELLYYENFIVPLYFRLFNLSLPIRKKEAKNECKITIKSLAIFNFKNKFLGLPVGEKFLIRIPNIISENKELKKDFLRGLIDTDGYLNASRKEILHMTLSTFSKPLFKDLNKVFSSLNFRYTYHKKDAKSLEFSFDTKNSLKYFSEINSHNIALISKYSIWKEFGFCPFRLHTEERLAALKGEIDFENLVKLSEKRKSAVGANSGF